MSWRNNLLCQAACAILAMASLSAVGARAGSDEEIVQNSKNPDLWPGMGQNLGLQRHSDLKDLNKDNYRQSAAGLVAIDRRPARS